ncbi:MAG TPA: ABATE domain-containing protein [Thermoanaerobaculia bacterium]|nr:ABATE domain-containing protein [Thermoanaerobaculia bacterium]
MEQASPTFELSGGALCLDFTNTVGDRERPESERLRSYSDLVAFARQAELLTMEEAARLEGRAEQEPHAAAATLALGHSLRETLYRTFSAIAASRAPDAADLERLNATLPEALSRLRLERRGDDFVWTWAATDDPLEAPLWPVLRSAADLLTSEERERVRECGGSACTWLFVDRSRNRSRRWCSMETCGNRAKARRHYHRTADRDD